METRSIMHDISSKINMDYELVINGRLPGMNEYTSAQRVNRYKGAKMKADAQKVCLWQIKQQLRNVRISRPVRLHYIWYEQNRRRDLDNISGFGHKVIQDALVQCKVLQDDGWKHIVGYTDTFAVDKEHPRIVLLIEEVSK